MKCYPRHLKHKEFYKYETVPKPPNRYKNLLGDFLYELND